MPRVSGAEWKIVCAVLRQTIGCQKEEAKIEVSEFQAMTGYERQAVIAAIRNACLRGVASRRLQHAGGQRSFRFRAVPRANLKALPAADRRPEQDALPFGDEINEIDEVAALGEKLPWADPLKIF